MDPLKDLAAAEDCWCSACAAILDTPRTFYRLCPDCGNKRCPKGTNHLHACSGSNDSGQVGSTYGVWCEQECCREFKANVAATAAELEKRGYASEFKATP